MYLQKTAKYTELVKYIYGTCNCEQQIQENHNLQVSSDGN